MAEKRILLSAFRELRRKSGSEEVTVPAFVEYFTEKHWKTKGKSKRSELRKAARYLEALFLVFKVENRNEVLYLSPAPSTPPQPEMTISSTTASSRKSGLPRSHLRRIWGKNLVTPSDIEIRVTECLYAGDNIVINFNLKKAQVEVMRIQQDLNDEKFVWPDGVPLCYKGLVCAAPDGVHRDYCRVVVLDHMKGRDDCFVRYLDFGFEDHVKKSSLRKLPRKLFNKSALAYKAVLSTSAICKHRREQLAYDMLHSDVFYVRVSCFHERDKIYEVHEYSLSGFHDYDNVGFCVG